MQRRRARVEHPIVLSPRRYDSVLVADESWVIELLSDRRIDDPETGRALLSSLFEVMPEFRIVLFGDIEPEQVWSDELLNDLGAVWPPVYQDFSFEATRGVVGSFVSIQGNHIHSVILLRGSYDGPEDLEAIALIKRIADLVGVEFGLVHRFSRSELVRAWRSGCITSPHDDASHFLLTSHHLRRGLPDLYWATLFGLRYVEMLGVDHLLGTPAQSVELLPGGEVLVVLTDSSDAVVANAAAFSTVREVAIDYLGRDAFFDPFLPDLPTRVPHFDERIAMSLRRTDPLAEEIRRRAGLP